MLITDIVWDYNEDDTSHNLPTEVSVDADMDPNDVADWLSDTYGYCVCEFVIRF